MLREMERTILNSSTSDSGSSLSPTTAVVDYYAITPKGTKSRFTNRGIALNQMSGNPRSETAILGYLKKQHPACDIQINNISFR